MAKSSAKRKEVEERDGKGVRPSNQGKGINWCLKKVVIPTCLGNPGTIY